jgi:low temperature requirement protein LtrA
MAAVKPGSLAAPDVDAGTTPLELFFDLVFVFLVTQMTSLLADGWFGLGRAVLVLAVTWWMYDGYVWLANNVAPDSFGTRLPMLVAMTCFLAMATVVPTVFGSGAWIFAVAYGVVVVTHAVQFARASQGDPVAGILRVLPTNIGATACLVASAVTPTGWRWCWWLVALGLFVRSAFTRQEATGFVLRARHFAERHQLLVIIALGETIIAIAVGSQGRLDQVAVLGTFLASMVLVSGLWWVYFGGDDERGAEAAAQLPGRGATTRLFMGYSVGHLGHIGGLMLVAGGLHDVVHDPVHHLPWYPALLLAAGVGSFLVGQVALRKQLRFGTAVHLLGAVAMALLLTPVGVFVSGGALLTLLAGLTVAMAWRNQS